VSDPKPRKLHDKKNKLGPGNTVHPEVVGDGARRLRRFTFTWLKALAIPPQRLSVTLKRTEVRAPCMTHNFGMHRACGQRRFTVDIPVQGFIFGEIFYGKSSLH
jgi:hypothetical protein